MSFKNRCLNFLVDLSVALFSNCDPCISKTSGFDDDESFPITWSVSSALSADVVVWGISNRKIMYFFGMTTSH